MDMIEYLVYLLSCKGLKPLLQKTQAKLALQPPTNVKQLKMVLGPVQYDQDTWEKISEVLYPSDLVGESGNTRVTTKKYTMKNKVHWKLVQWQALKKMKQLIAHDIVVAIHNF